MRKNPTLKNPEKWMTIMIWIVSIIMGLFLFHAAFNIPENNLSAIPEITSDTSMGAE